MDISKFFSDSKSLLTAFDENNKLFNKVMLNMKSIYNNDERINKLYNLLIDPKFITNVKNYPRTNKNY